MSPPGSLDVTQEDMETNEVIQEAVAFDDLSRDIERMETEKEVTHKIPEHLRIEKKDDNSDVPTFTPNLSRISERDEEEARKESDEAARKAKEREQTLMAMASSKSKPQATGSLGMDRSTEYPKQSQSNYQKQLNRTWGRGSGRGRSNSFTRRARGRSGFRTPATDRLMAQRNREFKAPPPQGPRSALPALRMLAFKPRAAEMAEKLRIRMDGQVANFNGTKVSIWANESPNAVIQVMTQDREIAFETILKLVDMGYQTVQRQLRLLVYNPSIARVYGSRGAALHQLQNTSSGARINPYEHYAPKADERIIKVAGEQYQIEHAVENMKNKLRFKPLCSLYRHYKPNKPYDNDYNLHWGGYSETQTCPGLDQSVQGPKRARRSYGTFFCSTPIREMSTVELPHKSNTIAQIQPLTLSTTTATATASQTSTTTALTSSAAAPSFDELKQYVDQRVANMQKDLETTIQTSITEAMSRASTPTNLNIDDSPPPTVTKPALISHNNQPVNTIEKLSQALNAGQKIWMYGSSHTKPQNGSRLREALKTRFDLRIEDYSAIGGATYQKIKGYAITALQRAREHDIVLLVLGSNDARTMCTKPQDDYLPPLRDIMDAAKTSKGQLVITNPPCSPCYESKWCSDLGCEHTINYRQQQKMLSNFIKFAAGKNTNITCIDTYLPFTNPESGLPDRKHFRENNIHYTKEGYAIMTNKICDGMTHLVKKVRQQYKQ